MLNFEHSPQRPGQFKGTVAILQKLQSLQFQQVKLPQQLQLKKLEKK